MEREYYFESFPSWVSSDEDEGFYGAAVAHDAPDVILSSRASCTQFVTTKNRLLFARTINYPEADIGNLERRMQEMNENMMRVNCSIETLTKITQLSPSFKVSASNADHGMAINNSLKLRGDITEAMEAVGSAVMAVSLLEDASSMFIEDPRPNEQFLVSLFTPTLMNLVAEVNTNLRLVNSECFQWLRCVSGSGHRPSDLKPDLFSAHHPLIQYSAPYGNAPECATNRLFGKFISWESRSSIHCIWDAKWTINMDSFGEKCKYLQIAGESCVDHNGVAVKLKGILFDKDEFWMITSCGNSIVSVKKCKWNMPGSKRVLTEFLRETDLWLEATNALCGALGVSIVDYSNTAEDLSAWLGAGANGRVFRLANDQVIKIVVGRKSEEVEPEYQSMLQYCQSEAISPFVFPVVKDSYRNGEIEGVAYAGYLLAQVGQKLSRPVTDELKRELAVSLFGLHSHDVTHGDPLVENVLILDGRIKWIDFRTSQFVTSKINRRRDVEILYSSLGGTSDARAEIEMYVNNPTVDQLVSVLLK